MGFRISRRIKIFKGLTLNLSKSGASVSLGRPGATLNIKGKQVTTTLGVPGTGISYRQRLGSPKQADAPQNTPRVSDTPPNISSSAPQNAPRSSNFGRRLGWALLILLLVLFVAGLIPAIIVAILNLLGKL